MPPIYRVSEAGLKGWLTNPDLLLASFNGISVNTVNEMRYGKRH